MHKNNRLAVWLFGIVIVMVGLSFAAVPLYSRFCRATGYGGATGRAAAAPGTAGGRTIEVRFDASTSPQLPWRFKPLQRSLQVHLGEQGLATYQAENLGAIPLTGTATYNVQPDKIGKYFIKIQCFCFTEQTLKPGETAELPVTFYVDPKIAENHELDDVKSITLSYTFFRKDSKALEKAVAGEER
jgi:cytochrome c oxidase assembly protein subunit 11